MKFDYRTACAAGLAFAMRAWTPAAFAQIHVNGTLGSPNFGPITPQEGVDYIQALFPNINQHRISGGIDLTDLLPGVDVDLFAGGAFNASQTFGLSSAAVES
jgi:hypothetical protein